MAKPRPVAESASKHEEDTYPASSTIDGSVQDQSSFVFGVPVESPAGFDIEDSSSPLASLVKYGLLALICVLSFAIRLFSVVRYESVIHEFDPYFNYRTTKYLASEGVVEFLDWFDDRAWYPLGRIIGGTIYPGLMATAASLYWLLNAFHISINVRNTCVFVAPVFAATTAIATYLLTKQVTRRSSASLMAAALVGVVPSYISRSVGGSYDNEAVAISALLVVFSLWVKAVHTGSMFWSAACALAYFYMVAAWGGYVFIINLLPIYVLVMLVAGRYSPRLYVAYSTFYVLGSILAMQIPYVGFNVIKQAECAGSHGVFALLQVVAFVQWVRGVVSAAAFRHLVMVCGGTLITGVVAALVLLQVLGRVQWTGRSLTLLDPTYASKYVPIIASVSEHQPTTWTSFFFDLHMLVPLAPVGLFFLYKNLTDGGIFVILYGTVAWYFAGVMVRLMLPLAPVACILAAIGLSSTLRKFMGLLHRATDGGGNAVVHAGVSMVVVMLTTLLLLSYQFHAAYVSSMAYSSPSIVVESGRDPHGNRVVYDDYREAYFWLRQNTRADAKVLAWWDYGYQLSAMANRTVLVDNNTWNNTHIATVGRALASSEEAAAPIFKSLDVDYVLVVFGGYAAYASDDMNKFLWPVRIGSGVFDEMPPEREYLSSAGAFDIGPDGAAALHQSVAYKLCYYQFSHVQTDAKHPPGYDRARNAQVGVENIVLTHLEEAFTSEHWIVRIYKVKNEPNVQPATDQLELQRQAAVAPRDAKQKSDHTRFVGCVTGEDMLAHDRVYSGGATGANYHLALHHAKASQKRYMAIARVGNEGHAFAFDKLHVAEKAFDGNGAGCNRPCMDSQAHFCGCADGGCIDTNAKAGAGQEHIRRWAVYERDEV
ncbi:Aste57867_3 [Aphanomyces stellatus]|uniref:dolichyl-diphosphooligosaccharide--protein glycotransferase n=1 Tax=Aphanomyces stellatus TaxID=120398 RepID=A0A485K1P2_9STRA|nr:hypothetical protein As57867_000003 [Aphanomyces stellatus]VFT77229.1 Aste57867_3 [Aphanomyces stellatus]